MQPVRPHPIRPGAKRKVRFADSTPTPSSTHEDHGADPTDTNSLAGFQSPEVVEYSQSSRHEPSQSQNELSDLRTTTPEVERSPSPTPAPLEPPPSAIPQATFAVIPSAVRGKEMPTMATLPTHDEDLERIARSRVVHLHDDPFGDRSRSTSVTTPPTHHHTLSLPPSHGLNTRTPSPLSTGNSIVAFSSRLRGGSALFAPLKRTSHAQAAASRAATAAGINTIDPALISPIDFNHHVALNNAGYSRPPQHASLLGMTPPEHSRTRSLSQASNYAAQTHMHGSLPSSMPHSLPSRDLSSLRGDFGVGHDMSGLGDGSAATLDVDLFDQEPLDDADVPVGFDDDIEANADGQAQRRQVGSLDVPDMDDSPIVPRPSVLPLYTRILRIALIAIGVMRYSRNQPTEAEKVRAAAVLAANSTAQSGADGDSSAAARTSRSRMFSLAHRVHRRAHRGGVCGTLDAVCDWLNRRRTFIYPCLVFLFILTNVLFVTLSKNINSSSSYNNWVNLASEFCRNGAPLVSWVAAFYMVGWDAGRGTLVFFEQLSNLESYNRTVLRNYLIGSCFAGLVLMATTNLTDMSSYDSDVSDTSSNFFTLVNAGLFVFLNYLITTFVICALASLICIFHYYSIKIFQEQLFSQGISVQEAIKEHIVLMRLLHESASFLQYIIAPPLVLYTSGAILAAYNMLSTKIYTHVSSTLFQLILAFVTLMVGATTRQPTGHAAHAAA